MKSTTSRILTKSPSTSVSLTRKISKPAVSVRLPEEKKCLPEVYHCGWFDSVAVFPNGRIFIIKYMSTTTLDILELQDCCNSVTSSIDVPSPLADATGLEVRTWEDKIFLLFPSSDIALIIKIDPVVLEKTYNLYPMNKLIDKIDHELIVAEKRREEDDFFHWCGVIDLSRQHLSIFLLDMFANPNGNRDYRIHTLCFLSKNKIAVIVSSPDFYGSSQRHILIVEKGPGDYYWRAIRSAETESTGDTVLKKLNDMQLIQMVSVNAAQTPESDSPHSIKHIQLELIDSRSLIRCKFPPFTSPFENGGPPPFWVINSGTLFLQTAAPEDLFISITSKGLVQERVSLTLPCEKCGIVSRHPLIVDDKGRAFAKTKRYWDRSSTHLLVFDLFSETLWRSSKKINKSIPCLPDVINQIIIEYCAGDFPPLIPGNALLVPKESDSPIFEIPQARVDEIVRPLLLSEMKMPTALSMALGDHSAKILERLIGRSLKGSLEFKATLQLAQDIVDERLRFFNIVMSDPRPELSSGPGLLIFKGISNKLLAAKQKIATLASESVDVNELIETFKRKHRQSYNSGFLCGLFNRTQFKKKHTFCYGLFSRNHLSYDNLTAEKIYAHARQPTFFRRKNRTRLILEDMKIMSRENGELLRPEFSSTSRPLSNH